jgi:hypothetical protein
MRTMSIFNIHCFGLAILCLYFLNSCTSSVPNDGSQSPSLEELVQKYFPKKELPLKVNPNDVAPPAQVIKGKDKELLFGEVADGDMVAIAQVELFPDHATIIYREDFLAQSIYIVSYETGRFSIEGESIIGDISGDAEGGVSVYGVATIQEGGIIERLEMTDGGKMLRKVGVYKYTSDNKMTFMK